MIGRKPFGQFDHLPEDARILDASGVEHCAKPRKQGALGEDNAVTAAARQLGDRP